MSYIDYNMAGLSEREIFSCTKTQTTEIYGRLKEKPEILGCVLIATCNRTELYLSLKEGTKVNPFKQLCEAIDINYTDYAFMNKTLVGKDAMIHLCKVAAGAESQIWGDGQIVTQVDAAQFKNPSFHRGDEVQAGLLPFINFCNVLPQRVGQHDHEYYLRDAT